ncbi:aminoacyl tRNA synthase complex-interacting multifunctional protein 1 isoform X2 [Bacillus rossius redtenbacheri]|uniref:aminoacyl tRNA synthase complex-interacting multifunctional protein 1 isoform X2 n=1 Tax=Bacillus rossius redtenbacheri TaxID=93214 RepID=UPI002FDE4519
MASSNVLERLELRAVEAEKLIESLKLEIPLPSQNGVSTAACGERLPQQKERTGSSEVKVKPPVEDAPVESKPEDRKKKEKKQQVGDESKKGKATSEEPPVDVGRLDLRVGRIVEAKRHPDADSLYLEQVDVGEEKCRTVVSGLVKHVPLEDMQGRMAVLLCNLKPAKMRGVTSEAMVMCASSPDKVEILAPPGGSVPGDLVHVEGYPRAPDLVLNPKKKVFETVAPDLLTDGAGVATYKGVPLAVPGKGVVSAPTLAGVHIK